MYKDVYCNSSKFFLMFSLFLKNASSLSIINSFLLKTITVDSKPFPIELELKKLICYRIKKINCSKNIAESYSSYKT